MRRPKCGPFVAVKFMRFIEKLAFVATGLVALSCQKGAEPSGVRKPAEPASAAPSEEPKPAPLATEPGQLPSITAEQLRAAMGASGKKATLVSAWASWCGPCRRELPMLQALAGNLKPQGVAVVLVTVDEPKDRAKALSFLKDQGVTLPSYIVDGSIGDFKAGINPRWPGMLPASFLFDARGQLVHFWGGEAFENEIAPVVENFLAGRAIQPETSYGLAPGKVQ
jgi:thiol-disulfide isomerase/thioredoxin